LLYTIPPIITLISNYDNALVTSPHQLAITVRDQRKQMQMSQADVADRVGLRQETISAFENKADRTKLDADQHGVQSHLS
jgi:DNA-binding XRE family transcriptional regulator